MPRTSLMKRQYIWSLSPNCVSTISSWMPKKIVAQGGVGGAPIYIPTFCSQYVSQNWNALLVVSRRNASIKTAVGTVTCSSFSQENFPMRWSAGPVLMLVYIYVASYMDRRAFDGIFLVKFLFEREGILKVVFLNSCEGLQPFCNQLSQRVQ